MTTPSPKPPVDETLDEMAGLTEEERAALAEDVDTDAPLDDNIAPEATKKEKEGADDDTDVSDHDEDEAQTAESYFEDGEPVEVDASGDDAGGEDDDDPSGDEAEPAAAADAVEDKPEATPDPAGQAPAGDDAPEVGGDDAEPAVPDHIAALATSLPAPKLDPKFRQEAKAKSDELAKAIEDIEEEYDNGNITQAELRTQRRALKNDIDQLDVQTTFKEWRDGPVSGLLERYPVYETNGTVAGMLDERVRQLQSQAMAEGRSQFDPAILARAHIELAAVHPHLFPKEEAEPKPDPKPDPKTTAKPKPATKRPIPPNLSGIAPVAPGDSDGGMNAAIDRMPAEAREKYLEKLEATDPDKYEKYLAGN